MGDDLPSGTVTFLFTDVEGSTQLLHELGPEAYGEALQEHRRVVRECFGRHGGVEVDTQGDAFFIAFASGRAALGAAREAQAALERGQVPVRMGLHTGTPHVTDEGYVGEDVHLGARIAAAGHGGQVLLSASTRDALEASDKLLLGDLGEHRLKDFESAVAIFQLGTARFPPLRTISNTNLPRPASGFVGREQETVEVVELVRGGRRLVTLTGPGGSGKTRLAIEVAAELVGDFPNGLFWVALATVRDPRLVLPMIANTIGAHGDLAAHIGEKQLLLLLDNLEQVLDVGPELAALVERCPRLAVLATSRELLRVRHEVEYEVLPLADPDGVELFRLRSGIEPGPAVDELCRRLDNMPLALELAAARTKALSLEQILERLSQRLDLFKGGRDAEPRQATLRATIEWSHELLSRPEQELFARLAVFRGGCTLGAAEAIAGADLDLLQSLVEKNLVRHTGERFWMLETIREFALERLESSGEADELRGRHAAFMLEQAESARLTFRSVHHRPELVSDEADNMRAAISWADSAGDKELALRLAAGLEMFWVYTNPQEGVRWYGELLVGADDVPDDVRAGALMAYGSCANPAGHDALAERVYVQSFELYRGLGDRQGVAHLQIRLASSALYRDDYERSRALGREALALSREIGDQAAETLALWVVGEADYRLGNREAGVELFRQSADLAGDIGFTWQRTRMLRRLADWALEHGDAGEARRDLEESLRLSQELRDRISVVFALARLARIAAAGGDHRDAGLLWGSVEAEEESGSLGAWAGQRERFAAPVLACAGPDFERGREEGRLLSLDEAVSHALDATE